ncbi:hypothetical protein ABT167_27475 [Streptomyces sp. NPDC001792]|uniref:hypothetical protein n=1 Tax=Streptomyces sp. NPDC001792 TaxID=3154524 RepID=UPI00331FCFDE
MADHVTRPPTGEHPVTPRVAELLSLCAEDYASAAPHRVQNHRVSAFLAVDATPAPVAEPSDLDVAISVGQQLLDSDSLMAVREALRLLLRALGAEPVSTTVDTPRCPAAHPEDPTPCGGPIVVTVLDAHNAGANGCEHHGARLLASLDGGRVYPLPDAPDGAAIRVFKAVDGIRPFPWLTDAPRTRPEQLSRRENRARGEAQ